MIELLKKIFEEIGVKKFWLSFHYALAIITSISFFVMCIICTFIPQEVSINALLNIYKIIMIYCAVVIVYIGILCMFENLQTMNKPKTKFDFIAFYIGICLVITLGFTIACIIFMFKRECSEIHKALWMFVIGVFGAMFITQASGGYINNIFKRKYGSLDNDENEKPNIEEQNVNIDNQNNIDNQVVPPSL